VGWIPPPASLRPAEDLGELSTNPYDSNSTSNPYGHYGSPYSPDSINNPFGTGNPYNPNSPTNPCGHVSTAVSLKIQAAA
jgi:hypothetical protein